MEEDPVTTYLSTTYLPIASRISALLAFFIVLFMIGMSIYDRKLVDRVSLRLQTGIAFYDIWLHTGWLWREPFAIEGTPYCTFIGWMRFFFPLFYVFINVSIGVNLQLIFLHNKVITKKIEALYWLVPIGFIILISILLLTLGKLGYGDVYGCYLASSQENDTYLRMLDLFVSEIWRLLSMAYLIIIVIFVLIKLRFGIAFMNTNDLNMDSEASEKAVKTVKMMTYRILLYPVTMVLSHSVGIMSQIYYDLTGGTSDGLDYLTLIIYPLAGLFNFIAFCCDPTVHNAFKIIYHRIGNSNENSKKEEPRSSIGLNKVNGCLEEGANSEELKIEDFDNQVVSTLIKSL